MKKYTARPKIDESLNIELQKYDPLLRQLLVARGVRNSAEADKFLNPNYERDIFDPLLLKDMKKSVDRILKAVEKDEKICIYSDYDADGIPGAVVLSDFFNKINFTNFEVYIPHRNLEGYGLNVEAIKKISVGGTKLLITIDCGISDHDKVGFANSLGLEVIITDHHLPHATLPDAFAVINPKQDDCKYPEKMLCGSGVIWKLVCAIISDKKFLKKYPKDVVGVGFEKWLLDMVGIATLSDMVPLLGENRTLAFFGLKVLRKTQRPGLLKLFSLLTLNQKNIVEDDVGFSITPRINAASRMGVPMDAFNMLSSADVTIAGALAESLHATNDERKGVVGSMVKEIKKIISERSDVLRNVIVLGNPEWKPSLLGLVANTFSDEHGRPVFLWGKEGGNILKGSVRAGGDVHIMHLMEKCKDVLHDFGGHKQAGGFSIEQSRIHELDDALNLAYDELKKVETLSPDILIDALVTVDQVNWNLYSKIEMLAPFGIDNPKPLFLIEGAEISSSKEFGKTKNHVEVCFTNMNNKKVTAIAFFKTLDSYGVSLDVGQKISMVATLEKSTFRNFPELRLRIIDIF